VVLDAIVKAGSLDPNAINTAIGQTDKTYVVGPIDFATGPGGHTSALPTFILQWQDSQTQICLSQPPEYSQILIPSAAWNKV